MSYGSIGYSATCAFCGARTLISSDSLTRICQVCGMAFCKRCGGNFVCSQCFSKQPPEAQDMLVKSARYSTTKAVLGLVILIGGMFLMTYVMIQLMYYLPEIGFVWMIAITLGGIASFCVLGLRMHFGRHTKVLRTINKIYFNKDSIELNFKSPVTPAEFRTCRLCPFCGGQVNANVCQRCGASICQRCGRSNPDKSSRVCGYCGNMMSMPTCPECGRPMPEGSENSRFCPFCGKALPGTG